MTNAGFLFAGFAFAWGLALAYLWLLSRRAAAVQAQIETLERRLEKTGGD